MRKLTPIAMYALCAAVVWCAPWHATGARVYAAGLGGSAGRLSAVIDPQKNGTFFQDDFNSELPLREDETIRKTFTLIAAAGARRSLDLDNVTGSIEIVGGNSNDVQLVVNKTTRAESKDRMTAAKREVTLDISQEESALRLFVNGPFRCHNCDDCVSFRGDAGYRVKMDFQLEVPRDIDLRVKTVNGGHVQIKNVSGNYVVRNVNGRIDMFDVAGSGTVHTVNGGVKVTFRENPRENSGFGSVNGTVELQFQRNLSADFRFKTFNGGIYSDFSVSALPVQPVKEERDGGRVIFRADRFSGARVGNGGPEIKVENLNGDIRILQNHE